MAQINYLIFGKIIKHLKFDEQLVLQHTSIEIMKIKTIKFIFIFINQQYIPFQVLQIKSRFDAESIITLDGINNFEKAKNLLNKNVFLDEETMIVLLPKNKTSLIGYQLFDFSDIHIGEIIAIEDIAGQFIATVKNPHKKILIPIHESLIININQKGKSIKINIADGLMEL